MRNWQIGSGNRGKPPKKDHQMIFFFTILVSVILIMEWEIAFVSGILIQKIINKPTGDSGGAF